MSTTPLNDLVVTPDVLTHHPSLQDHDDIPNPFHIGIGLDNLYEPRISDTLPPAAILFLQILFYTLLAFILLYLVSHWIFHSWSFMNIFKIGLKSRKKDNPSLSDRLVPVLAVVIFLLYTAYMVAFVFVTIIMMQFTKYYSGFLAITTPTTRNQVNLLLWIFFAMAMFPTLLNMLMALIKLTNDAIFNRRIQSNFQERIHYMVETHPELINFSPAAPTSHSCKNNDIPPILPHSSASLPDVTATGLPLVYIMIPVYNEPLPTLLGALNGVAASDYPRLRVYVGFDNYDVEQTFFTLCRVMTGVPLMTTIPRPRPHTKSSTPVPFSPETTLTVDDSIDIKSDIGRKAQKYNGFDQIVATPSICGQSFDLCSPTVSSSPMIAPTVTDEHDSSPTSLANSTRNASVSSIVPPHHPSLDVIFDAENCPDEYTLEYRGVRFTIHRFEHSGKLGTQRAMFERMQSELSQESNVDEPLILFMDSDTAIMPDCVSQMVAEMHRRPETQACTGFVLSRNEDSYSLWRLMQDAEYIESMIFRNSEAILGSVTCLPGVLTMFKYDTLVDVASDYFYQEEISSTFDFCRRYLGEDRYMTHLLMGRHNRYSLGFNSNAICKTEAPDNFTNLLRQRRRWFLGSISNEIFMICTPEFWVKYPLLVLIKFFMVLKVGGAITYVLLMELLFNLIFDYTTVSVGTVIWLMIIIVPNWLFVTVWAIMERRLKSVLVFPIYYWFNPFFTIAILMYSFLTVRQRTWGGPRAAAAGDTGDITPHDDKCTDMPTIESVVVVDPPDSVVNLGTAPSVPPATC